MIFINIIIIDKFSGRKQGTDINWSSWAIFNQMQKVGIVTHVYSLAYKLHTFHSTYRNEVKNSEMNLTIIGCIFFYTKNARTNTRSYHFQSINSTKNLVTCRKTVWLLPWFKPSSPKLGAKRLHLPPGYVHSLNIRRTVSRWLEY